MCDEAQNAYEWLISNLCVEDIEPDIKLWMYDRVCEMSRNEMGKEILAARMDAAYGYNKEVLGEYFELWEEDELISYAKKWGYQE